MEFIHPYWLFGLLAIAIPIIIHLFNFRRYRKYYFTNLKLLKSIKRETKKQHRLRHLLILISRILAITFLVLAFARPYFPGQQGLQQTEVNRISIYIDNSLSMQATANGHSILDEAISRATEVAGAYNHSDRFQLITNDFKGKHQPYYNRDEFLKMLSEVNISPATKSTQEVYERMKELANHEEDEKLHFFIVSDFQRSTTDIMVLSADTTLLVYLMPLVTEALPNVYIDSCWLDSPFNHLQQQQQLYVRFTNESQTDLEKIPVRLMINGKQRGLASFDVKAGGRSEVKLPFTNREAGIQSAEISIDDYPISWDDNMYSSWVVKDRIPVLAISEGETGFYLRTLFSNDSVFDFRTSDIKKLDYSSFANVDFIILDNIKLISSGLSSELNRYVENGGSLLFIPGQEVDLSSANMFLQSYAPIRLQAFDTTTLMATGINSDHEIFSDVFESIPQNLDLPHTTGHYPITDYRHGATDVIMDLQNSDPYLLVNIFGNGKLYLLASPAGDEAGNLIRHALWVPLMYRMAMLSRPQERLYYILGEDRSIEVPSVKLEGDQSLIMKLQNSELEFIPGYHAGGESTDLLLYDQVVRAGQYDLISQDKRINTYSFNYNREESDPEIITFEELEDLVSMNQAQNVYLLGQVDSAVSQSITEFNKGTELWKVFIWLALIFILMEILLLRLFRK